MSFINKYQDKKSKPVLGSLECINYLLNNFDFESILDVGCGKMPYLDLFLKKRKKYLGIDLNPWQENGNHFINTSLDNMPTNDKFDCVFSSHVIEHIQNTREFIDSMKSKVKDGGVLCIIFPRPKDLIVGGHVHVFNHGIMLYNIILSGIDCSKFKCLSYGNSNCVLGICRKVEFNFELCHDHGDIELLKKYFPKELRDRIHGDKFHGGPLCRKCKSASDLNIITNNR